MSERNSPSTPPEPETSANAPADTSSPSAKAKASATGSATASATESRPFPWRTLVGRSSRVVAVAGLAAAAALSGNWWNRPVTLGEAQNQTGLPVSQETLVNAATLVCPGQQRQGISEMRSVATNLTWSAASPSQVMAPAISTSASGSSAADSALRIGSIAGGKDFAKVTGSAPVASAYEGADAGAAVNAAVVTGTGADAPGLVASQLSIRTGDDDQGMALTPCSQPSTDLWLVGGGADASQNERLVLSNPGSNAVSAGIVVHGAKGPIDGGKPRSVSVPAGSRVALSLDALAPGEVAPAVHVTTQGGVLSAVVHEAWIEGATARGFDDSTTTAAPAKVQVVSGISAAAEPLGSTTLRLVNPGREEVLARVDLLKATGTESPAALRAVRVPAGGVADVPIPGGTEAARITSDSALVAAARVDRRSTNAADRTGDFGWSSAQPAVQQLAGLALPKVEGGSASLVLVADTKAATVTVTTVRGGQSTTKTVELTADATVTTDVTGVDQLWISSKGNGFHAAVTVSAGNETAPLFSVASLAQAPLSTTSIPVREVAR